jgi:hypothetical protein
MHLEVLVEDSSGRTLLDILLPELLGHAHTWNLHAYKGVGHVPKGLSKVADPARRFCWGVCRKY